MRRKLNMTGIGILCAVIGLLGTSIAAERVLRFQVNYAGVSHGGDTMRYFAEQLEKESKGALKCQLYWEGQVVKTAESFSALQRGMVDGLYSALLYFSGVVKEAGWEWIPFGWDDTDQIMAVYYKEGVVDLMDKALEAHGVKFLGAIPMGTLSFLTKFPVSQLADFKGKKIRASGAQAKMVELMGGAPVSLPAAEQYTALQRGVIDGTIYPLYTIEGYKFYEVITNVIIPGVHSPCVIDILMNRKIWEGLTFEEREALKRATRNTVEWAKAQSKAWDDEGLEVASGHGIKINRLSQEDVRKLREICAPLWEEEAKKSELCNRIVGILSKVVKGTGG
ncbi:MAG: TRAP transporter substrate-binding protein DctP [Candidatus Hadarchaeum sp.]